MSRFAIHNAGIHLAALLSAALAGCAPNTVQNMPDPLPAVVPSTPARPAHSIIPLPSSVELTEGESFTLDSTATIVLDAGAAEEVEAVGRYLQALLAPSIAPEIGRVARGGTLRPRSIHLSVQAGGPTGGGYELAITADRVTLTSGDAAGLFHGVQTLRQLLPWAVEHPAALRRTLRIPAGRVVDAPRFGWRGAMLDVSRHFLPVEDVKRYIDHMALYKLNRLHLHLSDDQGWRIEITSWPRLTTHGGRTEVGGGEGGFYTQREYADLVAYARSRYIEIVPEIDMPGHTNAALSSYAELNCDGVAPPPYTGTRVGFSALCVERDTVWAFVDDVVREISAMTPGPWFHIGGDEVERLTEEQYATFVHRAQDIVRSHGKQMIGWGEIAATGLHPSSIVQHWKPDSAHLHVARGGTVIMSPATRIYLDMKYDSATVLGLTWAAILEVRDVYDWDPAAFRPGVPERAILGVEAPLWSETLEKLEDFEFMAFPRLAAVAEVGWSPQARRDWEGFRLRLAEHGPRLAALGVNFYRSPQVPWTRQ